MRQKCGNLFMKKIVYVGLGVLSAIAIAGFVFARTMQNKPTAVPNGQQNTTESSSEVGVKPVGGDLVQIEEIVVSGDEYSFSPATVNLKKDITYRVTFKNTGQAPHNYTVSGLGISTATINPGESVSVEVKSDKTGTFNAVCSVGNHEELGMVGKIVVE